MKLSEIARYWAAKELTAWQAAPGRVAFRAPFACSGFTVEVAGPVKGVPRLRVNREVTSLREVRGLLELRSGLWTRRREGVAACFDLPKGDSELVMVAA